jgi:hypothetical protein
MNSMKTVVTGIVLGIVFSIALIFSNRAFASDALPRCEVWKHGHYICVDLDIEHEKTTATAASTKKGLRCAPCSRSPSGCAASTAKA